jgi:pyrroline-5-carboxylate reductase
MRLAVLGCGNMGSAIIEGVKSLDDGWEIVVYDQYLPAAEKLSGVQVVEPKKWFDDSAPDIILLAVKPQIMSDALKQFDKTSDNTVWISIAAGKTIEYIESYLPSNSKVCRVMPNTPALIGKAMSGFSLNSKCDKDERDKAIQLLSAIGDYVEVPESQMEAVTGVSGSGPAYVYTIIEALAEGGVVAGLPYDVALKAATQTLIGAAEMVSQTGIAPAVLRSQVMSPGGTTAAAVKVLEEKGLRAALMCAVKAAVDRAVELR